MCCDSEFPFRDAAVYKPLLEAIIEAGVTELEDVAHLKSGQVRRARIPADGMGEGSEAWPHAVLLHAHRWWASATRTLPSYSPTRASLRARELETLAPGWHGREPIAFGVWWGGGAPEHTVRLGRGLPRLRPAYEHVTSLAGAWSPLTSRTLWPNQETVNKAEL